MPEKAAQRLGGGPERHFRINRLLGIFGTLRSLGSGMREYLSDLNPGIAGLAATRAPPLFLPPRGGKFDGEAAYPTNVVRIHDLLPVKRMKGIWHEDVPLPHGPIALFWDASFDPLGSIWRSRKSIATGVDSEPVSRLHGAFPKEDACPAQSGAN